jgi:two-component system NtrC family sensor kinase
VENVRVVTDLEPDLPKTMVDFHQLQRVFLNIIINAHQAMASRGGGGGGELILRTRQRNGRILVEIADSGPGIAPENLGRVFDPFFTTKEVGQGTGLGLSICYGIVHEHGGRLSARNRPGGGAVFAIELPVIEPPAGPTDEEEERPGAEGRTSERKNILVVDDETTILEILYHVLKADGHRIDTAMSGTTAWRKIQDEPYDLIISDLKMPGMSGQELYAKVRQLDPTLAGRIIFATGDVLSDETQGFLSESGNSVIQKPFELEVVRKVVNEALVEERA